MATFDEFIASLEQDYGEQGKGKPFEVFCKWFLENDPEWSKTVDKVWLWDDYPNKWQRQDLGTDLVFTNGLCICLRKHSIEPIFKYTFRVRWFKLVQNIP